MASSHFRTIAGEDRVVLLPRGYRRGVKPAVLAGHGHSFEVAGPYAGVPAVGFGWATISVYLEAGHPVCMIGAGGPRTWNSDAAVQHMENARQWMQAEYAAAPGGVHLFGFSMGGALAASYAAEHRASVLSACFACPALDLGFLYATNANGYATAELDAAHGGNYQAAAPVKDPMARAAGGDYDGLPILLYHAAPEDGALPAASAAQFAADTGAEVHKSTLLAHSPDVVDRERLRSFLRDL